LFDRSKFGQRAASMREAVEGGVQRLQIKQSQLGGGVGVQRSSSRDAT
jgi:hypothetical protein